MMSGNIEKGKQMYVVAYRNRLQKILDGYYDLTLEASIWEKIEKSQFVMIKPPYEGWDHVLHLLKEFSYQKECFAPIVCSNREEILFFPQLRFQDSFLLSYLLKQEFKEESYRILYAGERQLLAI